MPDLPRCDNCKRYASPPPKRVMILVDGSPYMERRLCSACRVHACDEIMRPAPWVGVAPGAGYTTATG